VSENTLTYDNYYKYITKERPHTSHRERWFITGEGRGTSISDGAINQELL